MAQLYVARRSGTVWLGGRRYAIQRGVTVAEDGSEMLDRHGKLFQPLRVHYPAKPAPAAAAARRRPVEQATAAPGEVRPVEPVVEYRCDEPGCDAAAKSPAGLAAHKRGRHTAAAE